jgi:hypothetical protein
MSQPVQKPQKQLNNERRQTRNASNRAKQAISAISQGFVGKQQPDVCDENKAVSENSREFVSTNHKQNEKEETKVNKKNSKKGMRNETVPLKERNQTSYNQQDPPVEVENREKELKENQDHTIATSTPKEDNTKETEKAKIKEHVQNEPTEKVPKDRKQKKGPTIGQVLRMRFLKPAEVNNNSDKDEENLQKSGKSTEDRSLQVIESTKDQLKSTKNENQKVEKKPKDAVMTQQKDSNLDLLSQPNNSFNVMDVNKQRTDVSPNEIQQPSKNSSSDTKSTLTKVHKNTPDIMKQKDSVEKVLPDKYPWEQPGYADGVGMPQTLNEDEVAKECVNWTSILQSLSTDWNWRAATLKRIRIAIAKPFLNENSALAEILSNDGLINALIIQTTDLRSSLVKEAFETIAAISEKLGICNNFWFVAAKFLEKACLASVVRTTKVVAVPAEECGYRIVACTPAEAILPVLCSTIRYGAHPIAREKATNYLFKILKRGRPLIRNPERMSELVQKDDERREEGDKTKASSYPISEFMSEASALECLKDVVTSAIGDSQGKTREAGMSCLNEMKCHWPEYASSLMERLDPSLQRRAVNSLSTNSDKSGSTKQSKDRKTIKELKAEALETKKSGLNTRSETVAHDEVTTLSSAISQVRIDGAKSSGKCAAEKENCNNVIPGDNKQTRSQAIGTRNLRSRTIPKPN